MATESEHKQQARHNGDFLNTIDQTQFPDWTATVAFYRAVHLVEMLFAHDARSVSGSHTRRNQILKRFYQSIWKEYRPLYEFSRMSRYWCMPVKQTDVNEILIRLAKVEKAIDDAMK